MVGLFGQRKVGAVENVENLGPELHAEGFRNPPYRIVLEKREIQVCDPRSGDDIAARISPQIETLRERYCLRRVFRANRRLRGATDPVRPGPIVEGTCQG